MSLITKLVDLSKLAIRGLDFLSPLGLLVARLWVADVFWKSGMTKVTSWDNTINLFSYVYQVPWLSPEVAASLSAAVELGGSVLLALGLAGRFGSAALFVLNIVAVISYPDLSEAGLKDHYYWGLFLLIFLLQGPGKISFDHLVRRYVFRTPGARPE